ncbi:MAG: glycosyltransferase family 4 protein [Halothiobacillaceae bacterium]|nr:glycosyltransferase family 4 protein [Halothiobacillaceae bacterium]
MRIAVLARNFATHGGGAEHYAVAVAEQLAARHEVHVFAQHIEHEHAGITYQRVPSINKPRWLNQLLFAARTAKLTRTGFDIVHSHENGWAGQVQSVHVRSMRHNLLAPATGLKRLMQWLKILSSLRLMSYLRLEAARFRPCPGRAIGVVSATLRDEMAASYPASRDCLHIIPPGVVVPQHPPSQAAARQMLGLPSEALLLLFVANDFRRKGLDTLLEALHSVGANLFAHQHKQRALVRINSHLQSTPIHLMVVGHSAHLAEYQARCRAMELEGRVHFLGRQHDMHPLYAAADVLVHPTREDTFGMVVLEAMAQGLPVLVSRAPYCGLSADLQPDEAVLLHDPASVDELAAALRAVLDDDTRRVALAQAGRRVAARYDWAQVAQAYERLYFDLLARPLSGKT